MTLIRVMNAKLIESMDRSSITDIQRKVIIDNFMERMGNYLERKLIISWDYDDITSTGRGNELTEKEVFEVLLRLKYNHNCNIGINWEVIHEMIEFVINNRN